MYHINNQFSYIPVRKTAFKLSSKRSHKVLIEGSNMIFAIRNIRNIRKAPREVLKTEGVARGFQSSRGTLRMLMNDKIMFDCYFCIN